VGLSGRSGRRTGRLPARLLASLAVIEVVGRAGLAEEEEEEQRCTRVCGHELAVCALVTLAARTHQGRGSFVTQLSLG
jgi:hypothetical protein